jgi:lipopolysaccharide transport system ATP-binding protein
MPSEPPLLAVSGLAKRYCRDLRRSMRYGALDTAAEIVPPLRRNDLRPGEFWALDDVSFEVRAGEARAVIGHNGAGKSTLLRILCGLLKPDRGEVRLRGNVEALIELGTGFDPRLTGRENIELGAALRGIPAAQVPPLLDRIVDFAEIGEAIDAPLQSFSSGMRARLAYALSAFSRPELLLVDEVLAVGDLAFQHKCLRHMRDYVAGGGALLLVSHNVHQIQAVCSQAILLRHGRLVFEGAAVEALAQLIDERHEPLPGAGEPAESAGSLVIRSLTALPVEAAPLRTGGPVRFTLAYEARERAEVVCCISIWTADQYVCVTRAWDRDGCAIEPGAGEISCLVPRLPLIGGRYLVRAVMLDRATRHPLAIYGYENGGLVLHLAASPDPITNMQMHRGHLVELEAQWR